MKWLLPPVLFAFCLIGMAAVVYLVPGSQLLRPPFNWLGAIVVVIGLAVGASGSRLFLRRRTELNTFGHPRQMVTDGVFAISRNPMYLGFVLMLLGVAFVVDRLAPFLFVLLFAAAAQFWYVPFEERRMRETFGDEYAGYCRKTRRWI